MGLYGFSSSAAKTFQTTINPADIATVTLSVQTFTVNGLATTDFIVINMPGLASDSGVKPVFARVSAANTLEISFYNFTGGSVNLGSHIVNILVLGSGSTS